MSILSGDSLPRGWVRAKLRDVLRPIRRKVRPSEFPGLQFIGMEHIEAHTTRLLATVPASTMKSSAVLFETGDLLYGRLRPYLNKVHVADFAGLCSAEFIVLTPDTGVSARFVQYLLNSSTFVSFSSGLNTGDRPRVDFDGIGEYEFAVPPSPEQRRIVDIIESLLPKLDAAVAALERARANLKRYRASVLKAAVEGRLVSTEAELARKEGRDFEPASELLDRILAERRHRWEESELARMKASGKPSRDDRWKSKYKEPVAPDTSTLPPLPDGWCWATVEQLASTLPGAIQSGPFGSHLHHSEFQATGRLVIGIDNVQDGYFSLGAEHRIAEAKFQELRKFEARPGDVLVTVMATVGRTCVVPELIEPAIVTKHVYRISLDRNLVLPTYLHLALWGSDFVRTQMFGNVRGQTRPGLNGTIIKRLAIPIPPLAEQTQIVRKAEQLLSVVSQMTSNLMQSLIRIARLRQSVLRWAFEGRLVDQDPGDESASVLLERIRTERAAAAMRSRESRKPVAHETEAAK